MLTLSMSAFKGKADIPSSLANVPRHPIDALHGRLAVTGGVARKVAISFVISVSTSETLREPVFLANSVPKTRGAIGAPLRKR
jgi:hypothetical protein